MTEPTAVRVHDAASFAVGDVIDAGGRAVVVVSVRRDTLYVGKPRLRDWLRTAWRWVRDLLWRLS